MNNRLIIYTLLSVICNHEVFGAETVQQPKSQNQAPKISASAVKPEYTGSLSSDKVEALKTNQFGIFLQNSKTSLTIDVSKKNNADIHAICDILSGDQVTTDSVKSFNITATDLTQDGEICDLRELYDILPKFKNLQEASFDNCATDAHAEVLGNALRNCKRLKDLRFCKHHMTSNGVEQIFKGLTGHPCLYFLYIGGLPNTTELDDRVVPSLCNMLQNSYIRRLGIEHHTIRDLLPIVEAIEQSHFILDFYLFQSLSDEIRTRIARSLREKSLELRESMKDYIKSNFSDEISSGTATFDGELPDAETTPKNRISQAAIYFKVSYSRMLREYRYLVNIILAEESKKASVK